MAKRTEIPTDFLNPAEATGLPALPVSKVKKIIRTDEDIYQCNKQATVLATIATEMFVQYLAQQGLKAMVAEKKPRKTIQYKDIASAVARIDNLEFLSDVVPMKIAVQELRETKTAKSRVKGAKDGKKQTTLMAGLVKPAPTAGEEGEDSTENASADDEDDTTVAEGQKFSGSERAASGTPEKSSDREIGRSQDTPDNDVEMT